MPVEFDLCLAKRNKINQDVNMKLKYYTWTHQQAQKHTHFFISATQLM